MAKIETTTRAFMEWSPKEGSIPVTVTPVESNGEAINCIKKHPIDMRCQGRNRIGYYNEIHIQVKGQTFLINWNEIQVVE